MTDRTRGALATRACALLLSMSVLGCQEQVGLDNVDGSHVPMPANSPTWRDWPRLNMTPFFDGSHVVEASGPEAEGWKVRAPGHGWTSTAGPQLKAGWARAPEGDAPEVLVAIRKLPHEGGGVSHSTGRAITFDGIGEVIQTADVKRLVRAHYDEWALSAEEIWEQHCVAPRTRKIGRSARHARVGGLNSDGVGEALEWFAWCDDEVTWLVEVRYLRVARSREEPFTQGAEFVGLIARAP